MLFPTAIALYGVFAMIFAAKEAVEKRARNRGRKEERERISKALAELGESLTPRQARIIAGEPDEE